MKKGIFMLMILSLAYGSSAQSSEDRREIMTIFERQESDWNRGDIPSFMVGYWESDSLSFTGANGITYGYRSVYENYLKRYPDRKAMGTLKFEVMRFQFLGEGLAQMIGRFRLKRPEMNDTEGYYTLIWRKIGGKWVITSDHTSG